MYVPDPGLDLKCVISIRAIIDSPSHEQVDMGANLDSMLIDSKGTGILHEILFKCLTFQF